MRKVTSGGHRQRAIFVPFGTVSQALPPGRLMRLVIQLNGAGRQALVHAWRGTDDPGERRDARHT
jgi:hypothetical protein